MIAPSESAVWSLVFVGLGGVIITSLPPNNPGGFFLAGSVAVVVGVGFGIAAWKGWLDGR